MSDVLLSDADRQAFVDAVQRYARTELAALTARPEHPMRPEQLAQTLHSVIELGLVHHDPEPACGLWDVPADASLRRFSVEALTQLAQVNPAVAYQVHSLALGALLDRRAAVTGQPPADVTLDGRWGLGRQALGRALAGAPLSAADSAWLTDCWAPPHTSAPRLLLASADWQAVWWPQWGAASGWVWCRRSRAQLDVRELPNAHGFDELRLFEVSLRPGTATEPGADWVDAHAEAFIELQTLHGVALLAISAGAVRRAIDRARDYAQLRRQGGKRIIEHAAVQQLLAEAEHSLWLTQTTLSAMWPSAPELAALHAVWRARARLQPQLADAASRALQVFGGIGYMRDTGAEKDLRDVNTLRQLGGSPAELTLCCAALDDPPHPSVHPSQGVAA